MFMPLAFRFRLRRRKSFPPHRVTICFNFCNERGLGIDSVDSFFEDIKSLIVSHIVHRKQETDAGNRKSLYKEYSSV